MSWRFLSGTPALGIVFFGICHLIILLHRPLFRRVPYSVTPILWMLGDNVELKSNVVICQGGGRMKPK